MDTKTPKRKADVFAAEGSIAGILRKQRQAMESGDETMMRPVIGDNSSDEVLKRGYFKESDDE